MLLSCTDMLAAEAKEASLEHPGVPCIKNYMEPEGTVNDAFSYALGSARTVKLELLSQMGNGGNHSLTIVTRKWNYH